MRLTNVRLHHFRNHASTEFLCAQERNVFLGNNGEGKTNILEAISYLCLTKSFYASSDSMAVQIGEPGFRISAAACSDIGVSYQIEVAYDGQTKQKEIVINKSPVQNRSLVVGMFPVVVLSPENGNVTSGTPSDRRKFIDVVISQSNRSYLEDLIEYRRILRQRNRILFEARIQQRDCWGLLEPWSESLVRRGVQIVRRREKFVSDFQPHLAAAYQRIAGESERPELAYEANIRPEGSEAEASPEQHFHEELKRRYADERRMGTTLVGPHKDELRLTINQLGLRDYASQGQHKTFLVALKIAEFFYLKEQCKETPLLLLDDVFSELDETRSANLLSIAGDLGQTFITETDEKRFVAMPGASTRAAGYIVKQGRIYHEGQTSLAR